MNNTTSFAMQSPGKSNNNLYNYGPYLTAGPSQMMPPYHNGGPNSVAAATTPEGGSSARVPGAEVPSNGIITRVNSNDVLLGRGKETINYIGNIRFRAIIEARKAEYVGNKSKNGKDLVARQVHFEVGKNGGRFLKKAKTEGIQTGWIPQPVDVAVLKIKQAFQYQLYQKEQKLQEQREEMERQRIEVERAEAIKQVMKTSKNQADGRLFGAESSAAAAYWHPAMGSSAAAWDPVASRGQFGSPKPASNPALRAHSPFYGYGAPPPMEQQRGKSSGQERASTGMPLPVKQFASEKPQAKASVAAPASASTAECGSVSSTSASSQQATAHYEENTTRPRPADVLLGRGDGVAKHEGNIIFQKMVMERKRQFLAGGARERDVLSREIQDDIEARQGRFLKRLDGTQGLWVPIDEKAAMKKIKQSFLYTYSNTDPSPLDKSYYQSIAVKEFTENDVLLGRGRKTINNIGNIRFRELISARKPDYAATSVHAEKDLIARDIKRLVESRQGRFLEKLEGMEDVWVPVDEAIVLKKIKLCFRYHHSDAVGERDSVACPPLGTGASNASLFQAAKKLAGVPDLSSFRHTDINALLSIAERANKGEDVEGLLPPTQADAAADAAVRPIFTADLRPDDVLLGRGKETLQYIGNIRFRQLVEQKKGEYVAIPSREEKDRVARSVKAIVESRNGRFLKKFENPQRKGLVIWLPVEDSVAIQKTKTAFQYVLYQKESRDGLDFHDHSEESSETLGGNGGDEAGSKDTNSSATGNETRIQDLMAAMKQQLAPCQDQLGGADKIKSLVEKSMRKLQEAVSLSEEPSKVKEAPYSKVMPCMKELSMAVARKKASAPFSRTDHTSSDESVEGQSLLNMGAEAAFLGSSSRNTNSFAVAAELDSSLNESKRPAQAATTRTSEEELRQKLISQVSSLSTEELLKLALLAKGGDVAASPKADEDKSTRGKTNGVAAAPVNVDDLAANHNLKNGSNGVVDPLQPVARSSSDEKNARCSQQEDADTLIASLKNRKPSSGCGSRRGSDATASRSQGRKRSFSDLDASATYDNASKRNSLAKVTFNQK